jgi:hypothetical protein
LRALGVVSAAAGGRCIRRDRKESSRAGPVDGIVQTASAESVAPLDSLHLGCEADSATFWCRRVHELPDGGENGGDGVVVIGEPFV